MNYGNYPYEIFNPNLISSFNLQQYEQQRKYWEQQENIRKMVQAISDYCEAGRKLSPEYYSQAQQECLMELSRQVILNNNTGIY